MQIWLLKLAIRFAFFCAKNGHNLSGKIPNHIENIEIRNF